jgi:hypothetical protein
MVLSCGDWNVFGGCGGARRARLDPLAIWYWPVSDPSGRVLKIAVAQFEFSSVFVRSQLLGVKQTSRGPCPMSLNDPRETFAVPLILASVSFQWR